MKPKPPITRIVKCPTCGENARFDASNEFRPFCCKRCQISDTASWATESFRIAGAPVEKNQELGSEDDESGDQ